ncbi:MAG: ATP-binding protein [Deltaproteobacteria bacterium]|nr:ATP-binding protein [Deltaproteobacteria bacterium]
MKIRTAIFIFLFFTVIASGMIWHVKVLQSNVVEKSSLNYAKLYSDSIIAFRTLYSSEVVKAAESFGLEVTHDYYRKERAIPLPATLSILLGQKIGEIGSGATARLYSPYPFPWRKEGGGLKDDFSRKAWKALNKDPDQPFYQFEGKKGYKVLRYAVADRMRESCIDCHNQHPDSPNRAWKINDVRGVLDITVPLDSVINSTKDDLQITAALYSILAFFCVGGLVSMIARHRKQSLVLEEAVRLRTFQLEREKGRVEKASQAKTEFLSKMSHELRTPLNAIMGFGQLLNSNLKTETEKDYCKEITGAGSHLLALINEVLDLSKIESGCLKLDIEPVSVHEIISASCRLINPLAEGKNITVSYEEKEKNIYVFADKKSLKQVIINLLSNAIKYNRENGRVEITVNIKKNDNVRISIFDSGHGLDDKQVKDLFQPFERVGAENSGVEGLGIGLVICKNLMEAMNGNIDISSDPGKGSTFSVELQRFSGN